MTENINEIINKLQPLFAEKNRIDSEIASILREGATPPTESVILTPAKGTFKKFEKPFSRKGRVSDETKAVIRQLN